MGSVQATGFFFAKDFAIWLSEHKCPTILLTCDSEFLNVKRNPLLSYEDRIVERIAFSLSFDDPKGLQDAKEKLKERFSLNWNLLDNETKRFLTTGLHIYNCFDEATRSVCLDASPISICLSKALENEINKKILEPYRNFFYEHHPTFNPKELRDNSQKRMSQFLSSKTAHFLEMGTFAHFLRNIISDDSKSNSEITKSFLSFIKSKSKPYFFLDGSQFPNRLANAVKLYRNPSAHSDIITFESATEFLKELLGNKPETGLLIELIDSCR